MCIKCQTLNSAEALGSINLAYPRAATNGLNLVGFDNKCRGSSARCIRCKQEVPKRSQTILVEYSCNFTSQYSSYKSNLLLDTSWKDACQLASDRGPGVTNRKSDTSTHRNSKQSLCCHLRKHQYHSLIKLLLTEDVSRAAQPNNCAHQLCSRGSIHICIVATCNNGRNILPNNGCYGHSP